MNFSKTPNKFILWFLNKPLVVSFSVFLFLSILVLTLFDQQSKLTQEKQHHEMQIILESIHQNIEQSLKNYYTTTLTLALTIDDQGKPKDFEKVSKSLIQSNQSIFSAQLVPNGVIKYVYPLEPNKEALNLNLLTDPYLRNEALHSIAKRKMYYAGPLNLKQGGLGIVGRFPIFFKNKFWGFSAVVIKLDTFLDAAGVKNIDTSKYYFQFSKYDINLKKEIFYLSKVPVDFTKQYHLSTKVTDGNWRIHLISKNNNAPYSQIPIQSIIGIAFAALLSFMVYRLIQLPLKLRKLVRIQATKLMDSEIKFQSIFDQAALGFAHVNAENGKFIEINNHFCQLLGYSQAEMKTKNFQTITHPDDLEIDLKLLNKLLSGEINQYSVEKRYFTKTNAVIWVKLTVSPLLKNNKKLTSVISIVEDITLQKNNEKLIKKNEKRFKSLFEDSPLPFRGEDYSDVKKLLEEASLMKISENEVLSYFKKHPEFVDQCHDAIQVISANKACLQLYKVANLAELKIVKSKLFNDISRADFEKNLVAITQEQKQFLIQTLIKDAEANYREIELRWNIVQGYEKTFERVIVSLEDITDRLASENIILTTKQKVESLINTIDGIVWECDASTLSFNFISEKVEHILGYTAKEWLEDPHFWYNHIYHEDAQWVKDYCSTKTQKGEDHDFEYRMIAKDGSIVWLRDIANIISENGTISSLRGIMIDITKAKEAEKDLTKSFDVVSDQNKRLLNFSYIVSHNLRSHTSNIASLVSLLENSESEKEKKEMIQLLGCVSQSLNETMAHLNEVINIRSNTNLLLEKINLKEYVTATENLLKDQSKSNSIEIINNIPANAEISYNPAYMQSILFNIISNAIKYRDENRKTVISIDLFEAENFKSILQISDNGIGIDLNKNADKIFGMYKTFTSQVDSRGIGLFITKNQIDAMGGSIEVVSTPGKGTTFKIFIA